MNDTHFSLQPFPAENPIPELHISGTIGRQLNILKLNYQLEGDLEQIAIASPADIPSRQDELWRETCFEFFLAIKDDPGYWEFNLSPAGHWNVYRLTDYRQGMAGETAFNSLPFNVQRKANSLSLSLEVNLDAIALPEQPLEVGITTVIKDIEGQVTYWALAHTETDADFHRRDSFLVKI